MPLDFAQWCATPFGREGETPILVVHRYPMELAGCLWDKILANQMDLCNCYHIIGLEYPVFEKVGSGTYHDGTVQLQYSGIKSDSNKSLSTQMHGEINVDRVELGNFGSSGTLMKFPVKNL